MRIVQSLWSKPAERFGGWQHYHGHWANRRYFWCSWVLSTCWAARHYGNVELVTDNEGARWLVDRLKLPFTSVRTDLQSIDVPPWLWAFGKIIAYSLQREPFFHIDADVYLMKRLPLRFEDAPLLCQMFEQAPAYHEFELVYERNRAALEKELSWLPSWWRFTSERSAANCGIVGGANVSAIEKYARDVVQLITHAANRDAWSRMRTNGFVNCVIEQQSLWCSAREQDIALTPLFENHDFCDDHALRRKALELGYNHAASSGVKSAGFGARIERRVVAEFPQYFRIIEDLFPPAHSGVYVLDSGHLDEPPAP
jgi:hypothetical protein